MIEFTVKQFAAKEQVTPRTVWNWIDKGAVMVRRTPGGGVRIIETSRVTIFDMKSDEKARTSSV